MIWIIGAVAVLGFFSVTIIIGLLSISGKCSREEEKKDFECFMQQTGKFCDKHKF